MTSLHYFLLFGLSGILSIVALYYLRFGRSSISLFYFCTVYIIFIVSIPFASKLYSFIFNDILSLPDARISILTTLSFGMSIVTIFLLAKVSSQEKKIRIINREIALLRFNMKNH